MAELGRTVSVSGLPTDIEDDRLKDKLLIHFLRARNGGGEIDFVTIVKATPISAFITFEDSGVAQRVIQHSRHILEVDGKKYKLNLTEHHESLHPDKVILSLSATVDHRQLSGGILTLTSLSKSYPDVQIRYNATEEHCTLHGTYSKVQAALAQLIGHSGRPQSAENIGSAQPGLSWSFQTGEKSHTPESEDQKKKHHKQREQRDIVQTGTPYNEYSTGSHTDLTPNPYALEDTAHTDSPAHHDPGHLSTLEEDSSIIVDADMFQYLQKNCWKEYQHILNKYGVEVVDMTNQGLTTLFFQVATRVGEGGQKQDCLKLARKAISRFYQENESKICRAQLPKSILSPRGGLKRAMENINVRIPKLLLNEDDRNVYIIGSSSDVSEAKQSLLLDFGEVKDKKDDVASLLRFSLGDSSSLNLADEDRVHHTRSSTEEHLDVRINQILRSEEDEARGEGARRYKLAARFKDSGLVALGSRPTDFTVRGISSQSRQTHHGPMPAHHVLSERAGISSERVTRAQNTGGDILFKGGNAFLSSASMQNKTSLKSELMDTRPKILSSSVSTAQSSLSGSATLPPAGSGSSLKRASSFSGTPQQKAQVMSQKSKDDSSKSTVNSRGRSSSLSTQMGKDKQEVYTGEIRVSWLIWMHIKEGYSTRVDDLTSDVQLKEMHQEGRDDLTVTLRGAKSSKVSTCQLGLQKLIDSVTVDFSSEVLQLSELGVTDPADETLLACCAEMCSRSKKVTIQILKDNLYVLGPKMLCLKVATILREVFSGDLAQTPEQQAFSSSSTSSLNPFRFSQINENQITTLHCTSSPQVMLKSQAGPSDGTGGGQERGTNHRNDHRETELVNGSISQLLVRNDPVIREKVNIPSKVEVDGQKAETFVSHKTTGHDRSLRRANGVGSTACTEKDMVFQKKERNIHSAPKDGIERKQAKIEETRSGQGDLGCICVCGENGTSIMRTKCGVTMCSKCLDTMHAHCRVCHETVQMPQGIQGKMNCSILQISLPGHHRDNTIKITYCIPDGIQLEGHPAPGKPFQGGTFEAYLPDCDKARKLLPRLETAFRQGLTFTVMSKETEARVTWDSIPHKTSLQGGKSGNGYPDSSYLIRLSEALTSQGIEEHPAISQK
ncbi:uncharacterized protein si:busm1-163l24.3 isoform X1 [Channa argus]|uniref:uncharacterized protein si:busm1-163l24.3 isoform X1 n=1 Tax=Channa argus TaxID=215402 RepID=UPI002944F4E0|nr:hypothetical protein Q8A73_016042 [Channa argus]